MPDKKISPWLSGIVDTLCGAELLRQSQIPHRNRLAVILIDSAFETACRAYLRHVAKITLQEAHKHRENLVKTVQSKLTHIDQEVWNNIDFYYSDIRCDFYHDSATKTITEVSLLDYRDTVIFVMNEAFGFQIDRLVASDLAKLEQERAVAEKPSSSGKTQVINLANVPGKNEKIIIGVASTSPRTCGELNEFFKKHGDRLRLKKQDFQRILAQNKGSKKYFYYDREIKRWTLSNLGQFKLGQLRGEDENERDV